MAETLALAAFNSGAVSSIGGAIALESSIASAGSLLSLGSAASSIMGGSQGAAVSKMQARQAELSARQEELNGAIGPWFNLIRI